ncbi:MAG: hypothetical protein LBQ35_05985 [Spirochaetaceae bacterium]|nr:hypothetical protein [Spirochaetaceae bacterium]
MKKRFLYLTIFIFSLLLPLSCEWAGGGVEITGGENTECPLVNTVFAGEDSGGVWITVAFRDNTGAACFFAAKDGRELPGQPYDGSYDWTYSYDAKTKAGIITNTTGGREGFAPGSFQLTNTEKTLTFSNFGGAGELSLLRVRDADAVDEAVPFSDLDELQANLDGTVWAATGFRTKDWTTLSIAADSDNAGTLIVSHSFDVTSFLREYSDYSYSEGSGSGNLSYIGPFTVSGNTFTFTNFYGHGVAVPFKSMR